MFGEYEVSDVVVFMIIRDVPSRSSSSVSTFLASDGASYSSERLLSKCRGDYERVGQAATYSNTRIGSACASGSSTESPTHTCVV